MTSAVDLKALANESNPLFAFAFMPMPHRLNELAELAEDEPGDWEYRNTPSSHVKPVLYNYLIYTFKRVVDQAEQGTITFSGAGDSEKACFDTGLMTEKFEPIYAVFSRNNRAEAKQSWFLQCFSTASDHYVREFQTLPNLVTYVDDPSDLVFDARKRVNFRIDHIVEDNIDRFPDDLRNLPPHLLRQLVESSASDSKKRVQRNYKIAIPQFYRKYGGDGKIQLLLPLCLQQPDVADLALAFDNGDHDYVANTILTLDMAYNNARLLTRPDRYWLDP